MNIVMFVADDLGARDISPYGSKFVRTPHLKDFARTAIQFENAFASSPTCSPSRSSFLTGLMPFKNGAHGNHSGVKEDVKSIVQYLRPLNYKVAIAGKLHIGPESVFNFEKIANTNVVEPGHEKKPGLNYDLNLAPVDEWLGKEAKASPFFLMVADHSPHVVWPETPNYDTAQIDIPPNHIDTRETRVARARYYTDISKMDSNFGKLMAMLKKHNMMENTIIIFTADQGPQWAFAKWTLYDYGVKTPLMVKWPGVTTAGKSTNALVSLVDLVPTFVEAAGGKAPDNIDGRSFVNVLSNTSDSARDFVFATHTGDALMNRTPTRMIRSSQYKYILNIAPDTIFNTHMNRAGDHDGGREYWPGWREKSFKDEHAANVLWRYHNHPKEEFYDLKADPYEQYNLADDPRYKNLIQQYKEKLGQWRQTQTDTVTGPEVILPAKNKSGAKPIAPYVF
ncbi:MAG: sulfatase [Flavitalea sp.]